MAEAPKQPTGGWLPWVLTLIVVATIYLMTFRAEEGQSVALGYLRFKSLVEQGQVQKVEFRGDRITGQLTAAIEGPKGVQSDRFTSYLPPVSDPDLLNLLAKHNVEVNAEAPSAGSGAWLGALLPWAIILGVWFLLWRRMFRGGLPGGMGGDGGLQGFLRGRSRKIESQDAPKVRFADVAGQDNAKREVAELLEFLRDPERYRKVGAEVPHGILLEGPPGTGKTLLARALAGEAQVPFFHMSASEFIEVFVGVGASRVRQLFDQAKKAAPSIIFIDELDSVGRVRGAGFGGGHDEREQTLNQILAEMDGFEGHEAVVVLAATNRPDVLDPALLRPGRFDRHITLELPDLGAREAILRVHCQAVPLADDVDLRKIAAGTPGFSGADLKNLVNEAAMAAAREDVSKVTAKHFDEMRDRILMGSLRTMAIQDDERHRLAVHESGHAAVAYYLPTSDPLHKVTIIPRGRSLGATHQLPELERHTLPEDYLRDRLAIALAGRASEQSFLGTLSSGADEDIRMATELARRMVGRWGMSPEIGPVDVRESDEHPFLGREIAQPRHFSEETAKIADKAVRHLLQEADERARAVLDKHRGEIERLIAALEQKETLDRAAIAACLGPREVVGLGRGKPRGGAAGRSEQA
ncbi:cell division protease FtsH [Tistlia consotensis]|uniref:ATP-dependent zinc metalloprotease FtsH n=1 Tax=Tistlia consotensis USBA 355 TaxID=560819 RepID=A0A1Y6BUU8_9PROT|nr:ATP-dependent zinc metalloprotease FtsH [Tistlia consotensis]SMF29110.1 cell division protease FtsH [Tistlia consotensis USBA 355]SNR91607.1 cell division protease FtsH [Tistlia consotensis]